MPVNSKSADLYRGDFTVSNELLMPIMTHIAAIKPQKGGYYYYQCDQSTQTEYNTTLQELSLHARATSKLFSV